MRIQIAGDIHFALSHFALYGAAAILQQELTGVTARVNWLTPDRAELVLEAPHELSEQTVAEALHNHARRHIDSWVQARHEHRSGKKATTVGTFSPRLPQAADAESWQALQSARHTLLDEAFEQRAWLDLGFMHALGEPAYWFLDWDGKPRPDIGSSGWEMKTRNRGEEFTQNRLAPLADAVAGREPLQVLHGLQGKYFNDEVGRNAVDSRTPTGLRPPWPTDNALAWIALWGISFFPVIHRASLPTARNKAQGAPSVTTAHLRAGLPRLGRLRRAYTVLPQLYSPIRLSTLSSVLVSAQLARQGAVLIQAEHAPATDIAVLPSPADSLWLRSKGVNGIVTSVLTASDNPNAPELAVDRGRLWVLPQ